ncbi:hypothetical protein HWV62_20572 [Athelia sp. TMB]|nr:hypothetical protein HWV62_20572 [Athelia sp. TMB]
MPTQKCEGRFHNSPDDGSIISPEVRAETENAPQDLQYIRRISVLQDAAHEIEIAETADDADEASPRNPENNSAAGATRASTGPASPLQGASIGATGATTGGNSTLLNPTLTAQQVVHQPADPLTQSLYQVDLAKANALKDKSAALLDLGRRQEALAAITEATDLFRAMASKHPALNAELALSLRALSSHLGDVGQKEEALFAIEEAVELQRSLANEDSSEFNIELASSLNHLSNRLSRLDRHEEALLAIQESADLARTAKFGLTEKLDRRVAIDTNTIIKDVQSSDKKTNIHAWMRAPDTSSNYNAARKKHQPGTGSWFLDGLQFSEWKEQPGSVLWLYGGPGSGKTVMCSSAIENIQTFCEIKPSARGYAYFFFDGTSAQSGTLDYDNITRSIITQLSDRCGDAVPNALMEMYSKCDSGHRQPLESQLEYTLSGILKIFSNTYIVIDSLDECVQKADVLKWIQSIASENAGSLHIMLTSRPEPDIIRGLTSMAALRKILLEGQSSLDDINAYLDARLNLPDMDQWDEHEKQTIKNAVSDGSDGMFRWVTLQMDAIMKCRSQEQLANQLKALPKDLDATYAKIFKESDDLDTLKILLHWLAFAKEPMTISALAEVLAVDFSKDGNPLYKLARRYKRPGDILSTCYGLVTEFDGTVKLAHFSVKEYFIQHITSEQLSHSIIAQTCLAQLLHFDGPKILDWEHPGSVDLDYIRSSFPLAIYAAMNWVSHFHSSGAAVTGCAPLQQLLLNLFTLPSTTWSYTLLSWVNLQNLILDHDWQWPYHHRSSLLVRTLFSFVKTERLPQDASPLYYACFTGSLQAVQTLVSNEADVNKAGREAATRPLLIASSEGHLDIVNVLLEKGADIDVKGGFCASALQAASAEGHLEMAKLLLKNGADVNNAGGTYGSALQAASARDRLEITKLLLENGADVNIAGGAYGSALQAASAGGHLEIAKLLVENGADVNFAEGLDGSALQAASAEGHHEIARLLLENGADVNIAGAGYGSALQAASAEGHLEISKLLLENRAEVNIAGGAYGSALQAASAEGHLEIAKLLLENGADVNIAEGYGSALQAASARGHLEIAKLLLENGADVNIAEGYGSALQAASAFGHLEIAKLLLEKGADVNIAGGFHGSALLAASANGHLEIAKLLLENGANVNIAGGAYGSALQAASAEGHLEIAKPLLENGADVKFAGGRYGSALRAASAEGHLEIAKLLLENGADVNVTGGRYGSALQAASARGRLEIVKLLEEQHGAAIRI